MVRIAAIFIALGLLLLGGAPPAHASMAEVNYVAKENNCPPKKIEVYNQRVGDQAEVTYLVECNAPKVVDSNAKTTNAILIRCRYNLCSFVRPQISGAK